MLRGFELVSMSRAVAQVGVYARCAPQRPTGERAADRGDWVRVVSEEGPLEGPIRADHDHQQVPPALPAGPAGVCVKRLGSAPGCEAVRILTRLLLTIPPQPAHEHPPPHIQTSYPVSDPADTRHRALGGAAAWWPILSERSAKRNSAFLAADFSHRAVRFADSLLPLSRLRRWTRRLRRCAGAAGPRWAPTRCWSSRTS
jgi:hypothetical protein